MAPWWEENYVSKLKCSTSDVQLTMVYSYHFLNSEHLVLFYLDLAKLTSQIALGIKSCSLFI